MMRARLAGLAQDRPVLAASFWSLVLRLAGMAVSFVLGVVVARYLGPAGLGFYGVIIALALLLSVVAQWGLPTLATREISVAMAREDWGTLHAVIVAFALFVLAAGICLAAAQIALVFSLPELVGGEPGGYLLGAALIPLFALTVLISAEIRALGPLVKGQSLEIFVRPALTAVLCLAVIAFSGALTATQAIAANVMASAAALVLGLFWLWRLLPRGKPASLTAQRVRDWRGAALPLGLVDALKQVDASYAMLLLGMLSADSEAGYFRVALSLILVVAIPQSVLHVVLAPSLAKLAAESDRPGLQRLLTLSAAAMTAAMVVILLLLLLAGHPVIIFVFGAAYASSWLPLVLLTVAQFLNALFGVGWVLLSMGGGERQLTGSYLVSVPLGIAAAIALIAGYGADGAAAAAVVGAIVQNLLVWRAIGRKYRLDCSVFSIARAQVQ